MDTASPGNPSSSPTTYRPCTLPRQNSTNSNSPRSPMHVHRPSSASRNLSNLTISNLQTHTDLPSHHHRQPSLGELHQELESEQEAQVNRLLHQIRQQQAHITHLSQERDRSRGRDREASAVANDELLSASAPRVTATYRGSRSSSQADRTPLSATLPFPALAHRVSSGSLSRKSSGRGSRTESPRLGGHGEECDEVERMQTECQMVTTENQILKGRIKELEKLVVEAKSRIGNGVDITGQ